MRYDDQLFSAALLEELAGVAWLGLRVVGQVGRFVGWVGLEFLVNCLVQNGVIGNETAGSERNPPLAFPGGEIVVLVGKELENPPHRP